MHCQGTTHWSQADVSEIGFRRPGLGNGWVCVLRIKGRECGTSSFSRLFLARSQAAAMVITSSVSLQTGLFYFSMYAQCMLGLRASICSQHSLTFHFSWIPNPEINSTRNPAPKPFRFDWLSQNARKGPDRTPHSKHVPMNKTHLVGGLQGFLVVLLCWHLVLRILVWWWWWEEEG